MKQTTKTIYLLSPKNFDYYKTDEETIPNKHDYLNQLLNIIKNHIQKDPYLFPKIFIKITTHRVKKIEKQIKKF